MNRAALLAFAGALGCSSPPPAAVIPVVGIAAPVPAPPAPPASTTRAKISAGARHACFLSTAGKLACWGDNGAGQLGDGTFEPRPSAVAVAIPDAIDVAAGEGETCVVVADGRVLCWGGRHSQARSASGAVAGLDDARAIAVGQFHACALRRSGNVSCWGANDSGQLGDGTRTWREEGRDVPGVSGAVAIAAGDTASCAIVDAGKVLCWGGDGERRSAIPVEVAGLPPMHRVRMSGTQMCGVADDGRALCWGEHLVDHEGASSPQPIAVGAWTGVVDLAVGRFNRCALFGDGSVACMGEALAAGRAGLPSVPVVLGARANAVAAGTGFTCVLDHHDLPRCVGLNGFGQLGMGDTGHFLSPHGEVPGVEDAVAVVPAIQAACALKKDGEVVCWGFGAGSGTLVDHENMHAVPARPVLDLPPARALLSSWESTSLCAGSATGELTCFRAGLFDRPDELRTSPAGKRWLPQRVIGLRDVIGLEPVQNDGHRAAFAVLASGAVVAVRARSAQRDPAAIEVETASVPGLSDVVQLRVAWSEACAVRRDGTVACGRFAQPFAAAQPPARWSVVHGVKDAVELARNAFSWFVRTRGGEVFEIRVREPFVATAAPGLRGAVALSHDRELFAVMPDGALAAPYNRYGGLATREGTYVYESRLRADLGKALAVDSRYGSCLVRPDGHVACWGDNYGEACGSTERGFSSELLAVKLPPE